MSATKLPAELALPAPQTPISQLSPSQAAALLLQRRTIRRDLHAWCCHALEPLSQRPAPHHRLLIRELEAVARGELDRLMVLMPPGSAKSTYGSVLFPAWWFTQHPESAVIAASHTGDLAAHFGRRVRNLVAEHAPRLGYGLARDARAAASWQTDTGGSYFAAGVRGPITGRRADLVMIDDPVKSQLEADSASLREHVWDWYRSDLVTRLKPGGRVVLIMTRWHEDDLGGRLLTQQLAGGETWRCLRMPALAETDDVLGRAPGAPLWPQWESAAALARKRATVGERAWAALFQQTPRALEGLLFRATRVDTIEAMADDFLFAAPRRQSVRAWDLAATAQTGGRDPDWTVGLKLTRESSDRFVVEDIVRLRGGPHDVEQAILNTAGRDGRGVSIALAQDPGQAGRAQVAYLIRQLAGYHVTASPESGAKITRAMPVASQVDAGNLVIRRAPWNRAFLDELRDFPNGAKDDQVDALSRAFATLVDAGAPMRQVRLPLMQR